MSMDESFAAPIIESVNGVDVSFPRLTLEHYGAIETTVRAARKAYIKRLADDCKLGGKARFDAMLNHDTPWVSEAQVFSYLCTHDGAKKIASMSLSIGGKTEEQIADVLKGYIFSDLANLATTLIGFTKRKRLNETEATAETTETAAPPEDPT